MVVTIKLASREYPAGCDPRLAPAVNGYQAGIATAARDWPHTAGAITLIASATVGGGYVGHLAAWAFRYTPWPGGVGPEIRGYLAAWGIGYVRGYVAETHRRLETVRRDAQTRFEHMADELRRLTGLLQETWGGER